MLPVEVEGRRTRTTGKDGWKNKAQPAELWARVYLRPVGCVDVDSRVAEQQLDERQGPAGYGAVKDGLAGLPPGEGEGGSEAVCCLCVKGGGESRQCPRT